MAPTPSIMDVYLGDVARQTEVILVHEEAMG